jgi:hypothetical protein
MAMAGQHSWWRFFAPMALLGLEACGGSSVFWKKSGPLDIEQTCAARGAPSSDVPARAQMELLNVRYDGKSLFGRLLVSPAERALCLDKRLIESFALSVDAASECGTGRKLGFVVVDVLAKPLREEDVLAVPPGHWYGKEIVIPLFPEQGGEHAAPGCVEVDISYNGLTGGQVAHLRVRAAQEPLPSGVEGI